MEAYILMAPEVLLLAAGLLALFADRMPGGGRTGAWIGFTGAALSATAALWASPEATLFGGMLSWGGGSVLARVAVGAMTALFCLWLAGRGMPDERRGEAVAQAMFSACGAMLLAAANDMVTFFIAAELSTMPAYVLMGYRRRDAASLEGALKYFLLSMLTGLVTLYGLSLLFGASGTTLYDGLGLRGLGLLGTIGAVMAFAGMFAKISAAPFHFWTPDAYAGAPAASVAFVSTVPKIAGAFAMVRLADVLAPAAPELPLVFALVAAASMLLGNLAAYPQTDIRRLMAYSGIAHSGYLMLGIAAGSEGALAATVFYAAAYSLPSLAVMLVAAEEGNRLDDFAGLVTRRPVVAWSMVVWLLSLVGIPPMWGFFGKLFLFGAALDAGLGWLVVLAVLASVASAGYYFRVLHPVFLRAPEPGREPIAASVPASLALGLALAGTVGLGIVTAPLLELLGTHLP